MDRVLFWTKKDENIYSRSWELGTVTNSLSSSPSKAHKAHCPKKDISYRVFIVCHFQKAVGRPGRIKAQDLQYENNHLSGPTSKLNVPAVKSFHHTKVEIFVTPSCHLSAKDLAH